MQARCLTTTNRVASDGEVAPDIGRDVEPACYKRTGSFFKACLGGLGRRGDDRARCGSLSAAEETDVKRGTPGRTAAAAVGVGMLDAGLRRRSLGGTLIASVGGLLLREGIVT
jgi:hypothetical protein